MAKRRGHGEGSIYQREDGRWTATVELGRGPDGKRRRRQIYGETRKIVADELKKLLAQQQEGKLQPADKTTLAEYLTRWLDHLKDSVELRTWVGYEAHVRLHINPQLGQIRLDQLKPYDLQQLYAERIKAGKSNRTVHHTHRVLHTALQQAVKWELISRNPAAGAEPPKPKVHEMKYLTFDQTRRLLASLDGEETYGPLITTALMTGLRKGEIIALRWQDIDLERGMIIVQQTVWYTKGGHLFKNRPKSGHIRTVPIPPPLAAVLHQHRQAQARDRKVVGLHYRDQGLVFCRTDGTPLRPDTVSDHLQHSLEKAGLPQVRFHDLRHSTATMLIALGTDIKTVSGILGHKTATLTLNLYGHLLPSAQADASRRLGEALYGEEQKRSRA